MSGQKTSKVTLRVGGMSCASCVATIEGALSNLKGVSKAQVNFAAQKAQVEYDPAQVDLGLIAKAVRDVGYELIADELVLQIRGGVLGRERERTVTVSRANVFKE
ncbi:MAG: heavy-metal-associated domain-containing protein [Deltaproteobacteria bacterium]|nr:heavy-metal-associated domain-containing protein [Deltaproteobacteria bacterium]